MDNSHNDDIASQSQDVHDQKHSEECELMLMEVGKTLENKVSHFCVVDCLHQGSQIRKEKRRSTPSLHTRDHPVPW